MTLIPLVSLSREVHIERSALRKHCIKQGLTLHRMASSLTRGQASLALTPEDAEKVRSFYRCKRAWVGF